MARHAAKRQLDRWDRPVAIVCDRWRLAELKQHLPILSSAARASMTVAKTFEIFVLRC